MEPGGGLIVAADPTDFLFTSDYESDKNGQLIAPPTYFCYIIKLRLDKAVLARLKEKIIIRSWQIKPAQSPFGVSETLSMRAKGFSPPRKHGYKDKKT